jgi:transposase
VRYSLLNDPSKQTTTQLLRLCEVQQTNKQMLRAALLYGELRYIYKAPNDQAQERLDAWLAWAQRSRLKPFVKLALTIRKHKPGVLAAVRLGISNGRLESLSSKVRLLSHRAYGFHPADALIAILYLCCAGIQIALPHRGFTPKRRGEPINLGAREDVPTMARSSRAPKASLSH